MALLKNPPPKRFKTDEEREKAALTFIDILFPYFPLREEFYIIYVIIDYYKKNKIEYQNDQIQEMVEIQDLIETILLEQGLAEREAENVIPIRLTKEGRDKKQNNEKVMTKVEALSKLNNQLNELGTFMTFTWYNSTEFLIKELFGEKSSHFESLRELKGIDVQKRDYDIYLNRLRFLIQSCIKDVENNLFLKSDPSKIYTRLWNKYFSGGYSFESANDLLEKDLSSELKPQPKSQKPIKRAVRFISIVLKHPLWAAVIAGFIVLLLSHFIFHTP